MLNCPQKLTESWPRQGDRNLRDKEFGRDARFNRRISSISKRVPHARMRFYPRRDKGQRFFVRSRSPGAEKASSRCVIGARARSHACNRDSHRACRIARARERERERERSGVASAARLRTPSARITGAHNRYRHTEMPYNASY